MTTLKKSDVQWELMLPAEFDAAMSQLPVCFLPLGTVEWHGLHTALGLDSLKAHALCVDAAHKAEGGIVHPPLYGGMGGLDQPATIKIEPETTWENHLLRPWLEKMCSEIHRQGFKAIIMLTGHYGHNQQIVVREVGARMTERLQIPVLGTPEYWLAMDIGYHGDHAGIGETSLLWHLHPDLVAMDRIDADPVYGKDDRIKSGASAELGRKYADRITDRLAALARQMPEWDAAQRADFSEAERALVSAQVRGWRENDPWHAWRDPQAMRDYGTSLVAAEFSAIKELASKLL
ncbi:MAG: creatininase family protein [Candidatus Latescibacteria bacterium]|jgi:creatinine amidohydrolase|nr:creatininase family protein [Candidatus Latescibacterota bacterium]